MTLTVHVKVLRYVWETGWSGAASMPPWPDDVFTEIFSAANGWSVRDFWLRCTLGQVDIRFDVDPWGVLDGGSHETLRGDRTGTIAACRGQAARDGVRLAGHDHVVAFVHEPPASTGVFDGDAVLDQGAGTVERYRHEVGRLLGFGPTLGPNPFCVMGIPGRPGPTGDAVLPGVELRPGGRGVSAATLYRYRREFIRFVDATAGRAVTLTALSEASPHDPVLAVMNAGRGVLTVEYRRNTGADSGVEPAVVVHTIGVRAPGTVQFEARLTPTVGTRIGMLGRTVTVVAAAPTAVTVELSDT